MRDRELLWWIPDPIAYLLMDVAARVDKQLHPFLVMWSPQYRQRWIGGVFSGWRPGRYV